MLTWFRRRAFSVSQVSVAWRNSSFDIEIATPAYSCRKLFLVPADLQIVTHCRLLLRFNLSAAANIYAQLRAAAT